MRFWFQYRQMTRIIPGKFDISCPLFAYFCRLSLPLGILCCPCSSNARTWNTSSWHPRICNTHISTVEAVLKDCPIGHKNMVSQDRWSLVTGSYTLKCVTFYPKNTDPSICSRQVVFYGSGLSRQVIDSLRVKYDCTLPSRVIITTNMVVAFAGSPLASRHARSPTVCYRNWLNFFHCTMKPYFPLNLE